jgi:predicted amidohydrolase
VKDVLTISCVNFATAWRKKEANLKRILEYIESAARCGTDVIVFPEMCLTGYDDADKTSDLPSAERHSCLMAETVPGPSTTEVAKITEKYGIYAVFGMPERDSNNSELCYNAAAVIGPQGVIGTHRKTHLPFYEMKWAQRGDYPFIFETQWGPIGVTICYESYVFPELVRYYRAMGCRLVLNVTAAGILPGETVTRENVRDSIEYHVANNSVYYATANLFGKEYEQDYMGGSSIVGPGNKSTSYYYYAGKPFTDPDAANGVMVTATIDLSLAERSFLTSQWHSDDQSKLPDYRPELYIKLNEEIQRKFGTYVKNDVK